MYISELPKEDFLFVCFNNKDYGKLMNILKSHLLIFVPIVTLAKRAKSFV